MSREKPPVILSREEALQYAARQLRMMASSFELLGTVAGWVNEAELSEDSRKTFRDARAKMPEPKLQAAACKAGADMIDDMLLEERIVAARAKSAAGVP